MNQQQQRMAAVGTDKELSDLLDFSMVSKHGLGWGVDQKSWGLWLRGVSELQEGGNVSLEIDRDGFQMCPCLCVCTCAATCLFSS